jgi:hypothetical protein
MILRRLAFILPLFLITACEQLTGPEARETTSPARIRFVLDGESCRGAISLDFLIDHEVAGTKFLAAGDSAEFRTEPGSHTVIVRATPGPGAYGQWPTVDVEAPVRVLLSCGL